MDARQETEVRGSVTRSKRQMVLHALLVVLIDAFVILALTALLPGLTIDGIGAALAEAASLPAAVTETLGRWGCFLNGCCYGVETTPPWGVHFPFDSEGVVRHPTQIYYALGELGLLLFLMGVEWWIGKGSERRVRGAVLWPLFMVGYALLRWSVDPWRHENVPTIHPMGFFLTGAAALAGLVWLGVTWGNFRKGRREGSGRP